MVEKNEPEPTIESQLTLPEQVQPTEPEPPAEELQLAPPAHSLIPHVPTPEAPTAPIPPDNLPPSSAHNRSGWLFASGLGMLLIFLVLISIGYVSGFLDELTALLLAGLVATLLVVAIILLSTRRRR